ncbi:LytR/AlgR family response regulator transcription factor [Anaerobutyricum soehngenii]|uniref:LytR/AlgR family response regulator transcription factor n=1 Tax=Anaerobutyricum soehngenii TaxID=105843 RepID=UPI001C128A66|nr:LytTR family DNA-binding domain-containing protein [Anaerobutyricum soehngenii]MBU5416398.1 LytTR family DNA-binding domain-containing protein [Anaerobutyricum soehngenii]
MRIYICDDEPLMIEKLQRYLQLYFDSNHLKSPQFISYTSGESLLSDPYIKDIVFLDIEMSGMNGIYVGKELKKQNKNCIIFVVTSYSEYLDEAMRFHVFRYLSKPLDKQRLYRNFHDALVYYSTLTTQIAVETKDSVYTIPTSQLIAVEAQGKKVIVHTAKQDFYSVKTMDYWAKQLPENTFFQTHRSFIVNLSYVMDFDHNTVHLGKNHFTAYLTRRKYTAFKNAYLLYLESTR